MSLTVCVCKVNDETGEEEDLDFCRPIGFERLRFDFYGSSAVESLGLKLIHRLGQQGIDIKEENFDAFEQEIKTMQDNLSFITNDCGLDEDACARRLICILDAVNYARKNQAFVHLG